MDRMLGIELRRGLVSKGFFVSVLLMLGAGVAGTGSVIEYIRSTGLPEGEVYGLTALSLIIGSEVFIFILPIACTLAASTSYLEDMQGSALYYIMMRTTEKKYRRSKVMSAAFFGAFVTGTAILMLLMLLLLLVFPLSAADFRALKDPDWGYYAIVLRRIILLCLNGSLYSLFGGTMAAFTNNRYMAYAAPFIFFYVISTLVEAYAAKLHYLNPKEWILIHWIPFGAAIIILVILNALTALCYSKIIEKRWKDNSSHDKK